MKKLRVLMVHNYYQQPGGEDIVFSSEKELLLAHGHEVIGYVDHNDRINAMGRFTIASQVLWSRYSYHTISRILVKEKPDIVHFHNTFPLISPSAYYACYDNNAPVVQTLHNFRLLCPAATFYRNGHICEECLGKSIAWPGIQHGCYHESSAQTAVISAMLSGHRLMGTWKNKVNRYIVPNEFMRRKIIKGGISDEKVVVKPNFVISTNQQAQKDDFALFIGRLVAEKGVLTLLKAWMSLRVPLKIVGEGPLEDFVISFLNENNSLPVEYLGRLERNAVRNLLNHARFLIFPSEWYEAGPMVIGEAFSSRVPVIASRLGAGESLIKNGFSGLHFTPGQSEDLATKVQWAWDHPQEMERMGKNAFREYKENYTADKIYERLIEIFNDAIKDFRNGNKHN